MPRQPAHTAAIRAVADAQRGLITAAQLKELGVAPATVSGRVTGSMWTRVLPGVHLVTGGRPDPLQRERAALLYAGPDALLTGLTALRRHRFRSLSLQDRVDDHRTPEPVFVLLPHRRRRVSTSFVRIERSRRPPSADAIVTADGLPLVPPSRAIADASRRLRDLDDVVAVVTEGIRRHLVSLDELAVELHDGQSRGSRHLRTALSAAGAGVWSAPEGRLLTLCRTIGLPEPMLNVVIVSAAGEYVGRPDGWIDDVALALEVDSREHHADGEGWRRTLARQSRYAQHGVVVLPVVPDDLRRRPADVAGAIARAYSAARSRPRPPVRIADAGPPAGTVTEPRRWAG